MGTGGLPHNGGMNEVAPSAPRPAPSAPGPNGVTLHPQWKQRLALAAAGFVVLGAVLVALAALPGRDNPTGPPVGGGQNLSGPPGSSAPAEVTPTPTPTPTPTSAYPPVYLTCTRADASGALSKVADYTVNLDPAGLPDFTAVWADQNERCVVDPLHPDPVASSPVEKAAVRATGTGDQAASLATLYGDCGGRFDAGSFPGGSLAGRAGEFRGVLVLCPHHPDAAAIRAAVGS